MNHVVVVAEVQRINFSEEGRRRKVSAMCVGRARAAQFGHGDNVVEDYEVLAEGPAGLGDCGLPLSFRSCYMVDTETIAGVRSSAPSGAWTGKAKVPRSTAPSSPPRRLVWPRRCKEGAPASTDPQGMAASTGAKRRRVAAAQLCQPPAPPAAAAAGFDSREAGDEASQRPQFVTRHQDLEAGSAVPAWVWHRFDCRRLAREAWQYCANHFSIAEAQDPHQVEHRGTRVVLEGETWDRGQPHPMSRLPRELSYSLVSVMPSSLIKSARAVGACCVAQRLRHTLQEYHPLFGGENVPAREADKLRCSHCCRAICSMASLFSCNPRGVGSIYCNSGGSIFQLWTANVATREAMNRLTAPDLDDRGGDAMQALWQRDAGALRQLTRHASQLPRDTPPAMRPTTIDSWFPGYAWSTASCTACSQQVGWRFDRVDMLEGLRRPYTDPGGVGLRAARELVPPAMQRRPPVGSASDSESDEEEATAREREAFPLRFWGFMQGAIHRASPFPLVPSSWARAIQTHEIGTEDLRAEGFPRGWSGPTNFRVRPEVRVPMLRPPLPNGAQLLDDDPADHPLGADYVSDEEDEEYYIPIAGRMRPAMAMMAGGAAGGAAGGISPEAVQMLMGMLFSSGGGDEREGSRVGPGGLNGLAALLQLGRARGSPRAPGLDEDGDEDHDGGYFEDDSDDDG